MVGEIVADKITAIGSAEADAVEAALTPTAFKTLVMIAVGMQARLDMLTVMVAVIEMNFLGMVVVVRG